MKKSKRRRLEAQGWKFGSAKDFLGLTDEEAHALLQVNPLNLLDRLGLSAIPAT